MTTLQEQFEKDFPDKGVREINARSKYRWEDLDDRDNLNLSEYVNLKTLDFVGSGLLSVDFLNTIPNPEKLEVLRLFDNTIKFTDISIFRRFVNLRELKIGTTEHAKFYVDEHQRFFYLDENRRNKFYGSLKSYKNLTKLIYMCIEAMDVDEGLEYLPESLAKSTRGGCYFNIECSPHGTNAKCKAIQDQLRPFNYDLEAWQLAHPEKMLIARPELFTNPDSKEKWIAALNAKIPQAEQELQETKTNLPEKVKRIARLESKINHLKIIKDLLEELTIEREHSQDINNWYQWQLGGENAQKVNALWNLVLELKWNSKQQEQENQQLKQGIEISNKILEAEKKETTDKETQTDLTMEQIKQWEQADKSKK